MIIRRVVIPLVAAYALFVFMALSSLRAPQVERADVEPVAGWKEALRGLAVTVAACLDRCRACTPHPVPMSRAAPTGRRTVSCASVVDAPPTPST